MTTHELKTTPGPFQAIWEGRKTFEIRYDDRGYQTGDKLDLREFDRAACRCEDKREHLAECTGYTGRRIRATIGYLCSQTPRRGNQPGFFGHGYVVLALQDAHAAVDDNVDLATLTPSPLMPVLSGAEIRSAASNLTITAGKATSRTARDAVEAAHRMATASERQARS
jgi:hypothetical protein